MVTKRNDYIPDLVCRFSRAGMPKHLVGRFVDEAAHHPDEYPTITRDVNEVYPAPGATVRAFTPGILHWQWADGSGFPPRQEPPHEPR